MIEEKQELSFQKYKKLHLALESFLLGRNYTNALKALSFARKYHLYNNNGDVKYRKDGYTPEFFHQIEIALFVTTIEYGLMYPEETIVAALLHDVCEDYDVEKHTIISLFENIEFGNSVANAVLALTKKNKFFTKTEQEYIDGLYKDPIASVKSFQCK